MRVKTAICAHRFAPEEFAAMTKPVKTEAELVAMAKAELKVHADCPDGMVISVIRNEDSWEFRSAADDATMPLLPIPASVRPRCRA